MTSRSYPLVGNEVGPPSWAMGRQFARRRSWPQQRARVLSVTRSGLRYTQRRNALVHHLLLGDPEDPGRVFGLRDLVGRQGPAGTGDGSGLRPRVSRRGGRRQPGLAPLGKALGAGAPSWAARLAGAAAAARPRTHQG